jgi:hypothetical protein
VGSSRLKSVAKRSLVVVSSRSCADKGRAQGGNFGLFCSHVMWPRACACVLVYLGPLG